MPEGPSSYLAGKWFDAVFKAATFSVAQAYIQLHVSSPGPAGAVGIASEVRRMAVTFGTATTAGGITTIANSIAVQYTGIAGNQDAQYYTLWDASSSGNFLGSGVINANAYTAGDTLTFAIGTISVGLVVAT